jgi:hypothetical protein
VLCQGPQPEWPSLNVSPGRGLPVQRSPELGAHQLVDLREGWVLDVQAVCGDPVKGCVVQYHLGGQKGKVIASFEEKGT